MDINTAADIVRLSSEADVEQQMDLLAMMMQMDQHHLYTSTLPQIDQLSGNINGTAAPSPVIYNYNPAAATNNVAQSSPFIDPIPSKMCSFSDMASMREMIFRIAVMQPVHIDPEAVKPPKRRNVKISKDPQSVAARHRRERISERIRILQRLVPGGTKMDTASMLDEAVHYVKFLKKQVRSLEANRAAAGSFPTTVDNLNLLKGSCQPPPPSHMVVGAVLQQQLLN